MQFTLRKRVCALFAAILLAGTAAAQQEQPNVEYSADQTIETTQFTMSGKLYYAPGKERREMIQNGMRSVTIMRRDKNVMWMLIPETKPSMEMAISALGYQRRNMLGVTEMPGAGLPGIARPGAAVTPAMGAHEAPNGNTAGADWRGHVATVGRPCLQCLGQYDAGLVQTEREGNLDNPRYIEALPDDHPLKCRENVFAFSMACASQQMLQMLTLTIAPLDLSPTMIARGDIFGVVVTGERAATRSPIS